MTVVLTLAPHPLLHLRAVAARFDQPLGSVPAPGRLRDLLAPGAALPLSPPDDALRGVVRDLLRHGGFKPTGRSKPSSEYLLRAVGDGTWPTINAAVDAGNVVSLHSGLPISVVDLDRAVAPLRVEVAPAGAQFVFNASGQTIDVAGLLGLADAEGPCANAVKDAQRTKTSAATTRVLGLLWGHRELAARVDQAAAWLAVLWAEAGGVAVDVRTS